jgi:hypothetical protein
MKMEEINIRIRQLEELKQSMQRRITTLRKQKRCLMRTKTEEQVKEIYHGQTVEELEREAESLKVGPDGNLVVEGAQSPPTSIS